MMRLVGYTYDGLDRIATRNAVSFAYSGLGVDPISDGTWLTTQDPTGNPVATKAGVTGAWTVADRHGDLTALLNPAFGRG